MAASGTAVITNVVINAVICFIVFLVFSYLRISSQYGLRKYFAPKRFNKAQLLRPRRLPNSLFHWPAQVWKYKEEDIIDESGLDTAMYLRLHRFGVELFFWLTIVCIGIVLPVNYKGREILRLLSLSRAASPPPAAPASDNSGQTKATKYEFSEFDKLSLTNVEGGSMLLWAHLVCVYLVSIIVLTLLWRYNRESVLLRLMFIANSPAGGPAHTVLVTDIPAVAGHKPQNKDKGQSDGDGKKGGFCGLFGGKKNQGAPAPAANKEVDMAARPSGVTPQNNPAYSRPEPHSLTAPLTPAGPVAEGQEQRYPATQSGQQQLSQPLQQPGQQLSSQQPEQYSARSSHPYAGDGENKDNNRNLNAESVQIGISADSLQQLREDKLFHYDLKDKSLDPDYVAEEKLAKGMSPTSLVNEEFALVYTPQAINAINMVLDTEKLMKLVQEYQKVWQKLDDFLDGAAYKFRLRREVERPRAMILGCLYGDWRKQRGYKWGLQKVDAIDLWTSRLEYLKAEITKEQQAALGKIAPAAFLTFNTRVAQASAANALHHHEEATWKVQAAPNAFELVWENLGWPSWRRTLSTTVLWALFGLMCCFYLIPIAAIQGLIDVPKLAKNPALRSFVSNVAVSKVLEAVIPGLVLKIFLAVLPAILALFMRKSGAISAFQVDFGVMRRYYIFQVIVVFIGSVIAGSFFSQLQQWIDAPGTVITVLGTAIPATSTFFINLTIVNIGAQAISSLRVVGLVLFILFTKLAGSPKAKERIWSQQYTTLGATVVGHTLALLFGVVFSVINPIICPVTLVYFCVTSVIERYQNIYVFRRRYESGGQMWRVVFGQVMTALYFFQICMLGLLGIKKFPYTVLIIPLPFISLAFHFTNLGLFSRPWTLLSLHDAAMLDRKEKEEAQDPAKVRANQENEALLDAAAELEGGAIGLRGEGSAASQAASGRDDSQRKIADMYLSPGFKVKLSELEGMLSTAKTTAVKVDELQAKLAEKKARAKAAKKARKAKGKGAQEPLSEDPVDEEEKPLPVPQEVVEDDNP